MIGNDVIDRNLARTQSNWQRRGFLPKLFTPKEQEDILKAENPELWVWLLWSMKEAVYKSAQRSLRFKRFFAPCSFHCSISEETEDWMAGEVRFNDRLYKTGSDISPHSIHTYSGNIDFLASFKNQDLKTGLLQKVCEIQEVSRKDLHLIKNKQGVPFLLNKANKMKIPISLSHHGSYCAFALSLNMS